MIEYWKFGTFGFLEGLTILSALFKTYSQGLCQRQGFTSRRIQDFCIQFLIKVLFLILILAELKKNS
jgi:hypothetical protein